MPKHIVHSLHESDPYEISFHPVFAKDEVEAGCEVTVHDIWTSAKGRGFSVTDETPDHLRQALRDVYLVMRGYDAWAIGEAAEVVKFLEDQDMPVPVGLLAALEAEPALIKDRHARSAPDVVYEPDLLTADSYTVYAAVYPAIGDDWDINEHPTLEDAIAEARPAYYSGPAQVQIGSVVVRSNNAHGGATDGRTDSIVGQTRKIWEHPALEVLKKREASRAAAPAPVM